MRSRTDRLGAVGDFIIPEVGVAVRVPAFHPFGYDAKLEAIKHLDVVIFDLFGNQHLLIESLRVTWGIVGP